jgi:hypothetical protein
MTYRLLGFTLYNIADCLVTSYPLWYRYFPEILQFVYFMELLCIHVNFCCYLVQQNRVLLEFDAKLCF